MKKVEQKDLDRFISYMKILPNCGPSNLPPTCILINVKSDGVIYPEDVAAQFTDTIIGIGIYDLYSGLVIEKDKFIVNLSFIARLGKDSVSVTIPFTSISSFVIGDELTELYGREAVDNVIDFRQQGAVH